MYYQPLCHQHSNLNARLPTTKHNVGQLTVLWKVVLKIHRFPSTQIQAFRPPCQRILPAFVLSDPQHLELELD